MIKRIYFGTGYPILITVIHVIQVFEEYEEYKCLHFKIGYDFQDGFGYVWIERRLLCGGIFRVINVCFVFPGRQYKHSEEKLKI